MSEDYDFWVKMDVRMRKGLLRHMRGCPGSVFSVWLALGSHVGRSGTAFPSIATLAEETGYSKTTVKKAIKALEEKDVIQKQHRYSSLGDYSSNLYTLEPWFRFGRDRETDNEADWG